MNNKTPAQLRAEFWKEDKENGNIIKSQYDEIKRVLEENDFQWVMEKLKEIKQHAIEQTEFYKNYNVNDEFPVVNKFILKENYELFAAKEGYETPIHISSTGGSTGAPFSVSQDFKKRQRTIADLKVFGERCDYPTHERMVFFRVLTPKIKRTPELEDKENIYYIDSSDLSNYGLEKMRQAIIEKKPRILFSYTSTLVELAKYIDSLNENFDIELSSVLIAGEGLNEKEREFLESVFKCVVYRRYSDMELGILAQDNGNSSEYILNYGSYYFECLKMDSDEPTEDGEVGRIVITDLFNRAFPMIRYDTGDLGIMSRSIDEKFPVMKEIYGRLSDCIYATDGRLLSPFNLINLFWEFTEVKQWQFIQESQNEYGIKLNCNTNFETDKLITKIKNFLGNDANIGIKFVDEIPVLNSNKRKAVICNYKKS